MNRHDLKLPLPNNQTAFENAFAKLADRLFEVDNPTRSLFDPEKCPVDLLPYLAWALSVDVWDHGWPESVKRRVILASPEIHRLKGTRVAVQQALTALYAETEIVEWFDQEPQGARGTFEVTAFVSRDLTGENDLLSARMQKLMMGAVKASKPKSRTFEFKIGVNAPAHVGVASAASQLDISRADCISKRPELSDERGVTAAFSDLDIVHRSGVSPIAENDHAIAVASASAFLEIITLNGVAT